jgi:hypothetical protein
MRQRSGDFKQRMRSEPRDTVKNLQDFLFTAGLRNIKRLLDLASGVESP